jgi:hypothetical protein
MNESFAIVRFFALKIYRGGRLPRARSSPARLLSPRDPAVAALTTLLRRLDVDVTTHGFGSTFRDRAGDRTAYPQEVAEAALAHLVGNEVKRA